MHGYTATAAVLNFISRRSGEVRMPSVVSMVVRYNSRVIDDSHNLWPRVRNDCTLADRSHNDKGQSSSNVRGNCC